MKFYSILLFMSANGHVRMDAQHGAEGTTGSIVLRSINSNGAFDNSKRTVSKTEDLAQSAKRSNEFHWSLDEIKEQNEILGERVATLEHGTSKAYCKVFEVDDPVDVREEGLGYVTQIESGCKYKVRITEEGTKNNGVTISDVSDTDMMMYKVFKAGDTVCVVNQFQSNQTPSVTLTVGLTGTIRKVDKDKDYDIAFNWPSESNHSKNQWVYRNNAHNNLQIVLKKGDKVRVVNEFDKVREAPLTDGLIGTIINVLDADYEIKFNWPSGSTNRNPQLVSKTNANRLEIVFEVGDRVQIVGPAWNRNRHDIGKAGAIEQGADEDGEYTVRLDQGDDMQFPASSMSAACPSKPATGYCKCGNGVLHCEAGETCQLAFSTRGLGFGTKCEKAVVFKKGDTVRIVNQFESQYKNSAPLTVGLIGTITDLYDGDYAIKFNWPSGSSNKETQLVSKTNADKLEIVSLPDRFVLSTKKVPEVSGIYELCESAQCKQKDNGFPVWQRRDEKAWFWSNLNGQWMAADDKSSIGTNSGFFLSASAHGGSLDVKKWFYSTHDGWLEDAEAYVSANV